MAKGSHNNDVCIDVDSYRFDDVIIIDDIESTTKKFQGSNVTMRSKKSPFYIYVDDCDVDSDECSTSGTFPSSSQLHFVDLDGEESGEFHPMEKRRRRNYGKAPARYHFGFYVDSDSNSSESDGSDCELMEGSFGKLKKQWEEASVRKKNDVSDYFTADNQPKDSASHGDSGSKFDVENQMKQHSEAQACSASGNTGNSCGSQTKLKSTLSENRHLTPPVVKDIICERERLKETDEYRQAMEEEWTTRQQELQSQAAEAQRLRRKRKADRMRLLEMQRRQMERLEEVRETQKKDEENINLKEKLRVDVRKELSKLEMTCKDMATLLRCLGIQVGSDTRPSSNEVQAAYKKAVLRFHPDRVSRTDTRLLVEAEEKFKLISHMKKKFVF